MVLKCCERVHCQELACQWELLVDALVTGNLPGIADNALRYAFLWYNFMPLARGTAVVGYITMLAIFSAAGMPITTPAPRVRNAVGVLLDRVHLMPSARCGV